MELITLPNGRNICISSASPNSWQGNNYWLRLEDDGAFHVTQFNDATLQIVYIVSDRKSLTSFIWYPILDTRISVLLLLPSFRHHHGNHHWFLKCGELESSGQRLISLNCILLAKRKYVFIYIIDFFFYYYLEISSNCLDILIY